VDVICLKKQAPVFRAGKGIRFCRKNNTALKKNANRFNRPFPCKSLNFAEFLP
jgi:hypothetical protein